MPVSMALSLSKNLPPLFQQVTGLCDGVVGPRQDGVCFTTELVVAHDTLHAKAGAQSRLSVSGGPGDDMPVMRSQ